MEESVIFYGISSYALERISCYLVWEDKLRLSYVNRKMNDLMIPILKEHRPYDYEKIINDKSINFEKIRSLHNVSDIIDLHLFPNLLEVRTKNIKLPNLREDNMKNIFPNTLLKLELDLHEDCYLEPGIFRNILNLDTLIFGDYFKNGRMPLVSDIFPNSLYFLSMGRRFKNGREPLKPGVLPDNIHTLLFGEFFTNGDEPFSPNVLPKNLKSLYITRSDFSNGNKPITEGVLPPNLLRLDFDRTNYDNGRISIGHGIMPNTLTHISLGKKYVKPFLSVTVLPQSLKYLEIAIECFFEEGSNSVLAKWIEECHENIANPHLKCLKYLGILEDLKYLGILEDSYDSKFLEYKYVPRMFPFNVKFMWDERHLITTVNLITNETDVRIVDCSIFPISLIEFSSDNVYTYINVPSNLKIT